MRHLGRLAALAGVLPLAMIMPPSAQVQQAQPARRPVQQTQPRRESRLNRSKHWDHAETYKDARFISPFPHRPVR